MTDAAGTEPTALDLAPLDRLVARLRGPGGCPWDREQGFDEIRAYLLEEAHEVAAAIDDRDWGGLTEELGDLLFQLAFLGRLNAESGRPGLERSIAAVCAKMVERHPHVFAEAASDASDAPELDAEAVAAAWERRKLAQRSEGSLLDGIAATMPSLLASYRMTQKAAGVGFDWPDAAAVLGKVREELGEVEEAMGAGARDLAAEEVGDLIFAVANLARHLGVDPESATARANLKFRRRFGRVEEGLRRRGRRLDEATLEEMDALWEEAKAAERADAG